jgi:hypothetical protein
VQQEEAEAVLVETARRYVRLVLNLEIVSLAYRILIMAMSFTLPSLYKAFHSETDFQGNAPFALNYGKVIEMIVFVLMTPGILVAIIFGIAYYSELRVRKGKVENSHIQDRPRHLGAISTEIKGVLGMCVALLALALGPFLVGMVATLLVDTFLQGFKEAANNGVALYSLLSHTVAGALPLFMIGVYDRKLREEDPTLRLIDKTGEMVTSQIQNLGSRSITDLGHKERQFMKAANKGNIDKMLDVADEREPGEHEEWLSTREVCAHFGLPYRAGNKATQAVQSRLSFLRTKYPNLVRKKSNGRGLECSSIMLPKVIKDIDAFRQKYRDSLVEQ